MDIPQRKRNRYKRLKAKATRKTKKRLGIPKCRPLPKHVRKEIEAAVMQVIKHELITEGRNYKLKEVRWGLPKGVRCLAWYWDGRKVRQCLRKAEGGYCEMHLPKQRNKHHSSTTG